MTVILLLLAILLVAVVIPLFTPVRYSLYISTADRYEVRFRTGWLGKLFRIGFSWKSREPYLFEVYIGGKLRAGTVKEYQAWLAQQVREELGTEPEKERDYLFNGTEDATEAQPKAEDTESTASDTGSESTKESASSSEEEIESSLSKAKKQLEKLKNLDLSWIVSQICSWEFQSALFTMLTDMYRHTKPRHVSITGKVGTGDPAYTAMLQGFLYSQSAELWGALEFEYLEPTCRGTFEMSGKIIPARMAWYGMRFALSRPARDVMMHVSKGMLKGGK